MSGREIASTLLLVSIFGLSINVAVASTELVPFWYLTRGGPNTDGAWAVTTDSAGNVYLGDHETVPGPWSDDYLYKFTSDGQEVWKTRWGGPWNEQAFILAVRGDRVYMGGRTDKQLAPTSGDMAVVAFDISDGHMVWEFTWDQGYGYEEVDGLVVDGDYIYVAGWTTGEKSQNDLAVLKLDLNGNLVWKTTWGTDGWDEENGQIVVDSENVYLAGRYNGQNMFLGGDALLAAFDKTTGAYKWHKTWGGVGTDDALGMIGDLPYLYVVGMTSSFGQAMQIFLNKYSLSGNLLWSRIWGGPAGDYSRTLAIGKDHCVFVGGRTDSYGNGQNDVLLLKYDQDGNLSWYKTWGGSGADETHGIVMYEDFIYIAGETGSYGAGKQDSLLMKVDANGENVIPEFTNISVILLAATIAASVLISKYRNLLQAYEPHESTNPHQDENTREGNSHWCGRRDSNRHEK